jgi:hypothetical protein
MPTALSSCRFLSIKKEPFGPILHFFTFVLWVSNGTYQQQAKFAPWVLVEVHAFQQQTNSLAALSFPLASANTN